MPLQRPIILFFGFIFSTLFSVANAIGAAVTDTISATSRIDYLSTGSVSITDSIINYGKQFLNRPYRYGSGGADTFDCSGFTSFVYRNFGYKLEHSSAEQAQQFDTVKRTHLKTGDLVFFAGSRRSKRVGHVGIVTTASEDGKFNFIHASCDKGVTISSSEEPYYSSRYIKANRVIGGTQLLAVAPSVSESANADIQSDNNAPVTYPAKKVKKTIPAKYHKVKSGETLSEIAEKYGLSVAELKRKNGLKGNKINLKQQLKVKDSETYTVFEPVKEVPAKKTDASAEQAVEKSKAEIASSIVSHKVKRGETLFSISKLYNTPVEELKRINNIPTGKIVPGQEIKVSEGDVQPTTMVTQNEQQPKVSTHKVSSGESLFSIAKMYNLSVAELKKMNEMTGNALHVGQVLKVNVPEEKNIADNLQPAKPVQVKPETKSTPKTEQPVVKTDLAQRAEPKPEPEQSEPEDVKTEVVTKTGSPVKIIKHKVHAGESLVTIARDFKVSLDELKRINNLESTKLNVGQEVFICLNTEAVVINPVATAASKPIVEEQPVEKATINPAKNAVASRADVVSKSEQKQKTQKKAEQKPLSYKVRKGDNLNTIAKEFDISVDDLKKMNNLTSNKISVGQELKFVQPDAGVSSKEEAKKIEMPAKAVIHKVRKGENLGTIAKDFNVSVEDLKKMNNLTSNKISVGQELKFVQPDAGVSSKEEAKKIEMPAKAVIHKVRKGENLGTIAKDFNVSVEDLKKMNNLTSNKISVGQELKLEQDVAEVSSKEEAKKIEMPAKAVTHKVRKGENLATIAEKFNMTVDELKELNGLTSNKINYGQQLVVSQLSTAEVKKAPVKAETKQRTIKHKVKSGDSYYSIAQKYDCSVNDLKEWNGKSGTKIKPGDIIIIKAKK